MTTISSSREPTEEDFDHTPGAALGNVRLTRSFQNPRSQPPRTLSHSDRTSQFENGHTLRRLTAEL